MSAAWEGRSQRRPLPALEVLQGEPWARCHRGAWWRRAGMGLVVTYFLKLVLEIVGEVLREWKSTATSASLPSCKCFTQGRSYCSVPGVGVVPELCPETQVPRSAAPQPLSACSLACTWGLCLSFPLSLWAHHHPPRHQLSFRQQ